MKLGKAHHTMGRAVKSLEAKMSCPIGGTARLLGWECRKSDPEVRDSGRRSREVVWGQTTTVD